MTQRIFDVDNPQEIFDLFPDDVIRIEKSDRKDTQDIIIFDDDCWDYTHIKINWRDKTEITRPVRRDEVKFVEKAELTYKTFSDLRWEPHLLAIESQGKDFLSKNKDAKHAVIIFDNGYGVSVVRDCPLITDVHNFEIAVIKGTQNSYSLVYDTGITDDVIRCDTEDEITDIMRQVQDL